MSSAVCEFCDKKPHFSYQVSFSHKRSKRRWNPNVQKIRIWENGGVRRATVCTACMKGGKVTRPPQRTIQS
jgi:large subunit ribosomal protein L28